MTQPAYLRIADNLRQQIVDGRLAPSDRVPSRHQLAREHGVSDRVAVEAVRLLVSEGYVESRSGSGTYVRQRPQVKRLTRSWYREARGRGSSPFRADMEAQGRAGRGVPPRRRPGVAGRGRAAWHCGGRPCAGDAVHLSRGRAARHALDLLGAAGHHAWDASDAARRGPYAGAGVIARMRAIGQEVTLATEVVTARAILADEAEQLGEPVGSIVMVIQRLHRGPSGRDRRHRGARRPLRVGLHHPRRLTAAEVVGHAVLGAISGRSGCAATDQAATDAMRGLSDDGLRAA